MRYIDINWCKDGLGVRVNNTVHQWYYKTIAFNACVWVLRIAFVVWFVWAVKYSLIPHIRSVYGI